MKKIALLVLFGLSLNFCFAQLNDIRFGLQISPSFSWMTTNTNRINSSGTNLGLKLGMIGEFYFRENYAFSTGIGFAFNSGGTLLHEWEGTYWEEPRSERTTDNSPLPQQTKLKYNLQFLEIPLALKLRTREFGFIRYYVEPGLTLGIKTQANGKITGDGLGEEFEDLNIRTETNAVNIAWGIGAGVEYGLSETTALVAGIGFQVGIADMTRDNAMEINPNTGVTSEEDSAGKVHAITLKLAVLF